MRSLAAELLPHLMEPPGHFMTMTPGGIQRVRGYIEVSLDVVVLHLQRFAFAHRSVAPLLNLRLLHRSLRALLVQAPTLRVEALRS